MNKVVIYACVYYLDDREAYRSYHSTNCHDFHKRILQSAVRPHFISTILEVDVLNTCFFLQCCPLRQCSILTGQLRTDARQDLSVANTE